MNHQDDHPMDPADLHQKAEELARKRTAATPDGSADLSLEEMRKTIHELRLQQIELERQNGELRAGQTQAKAEESLRDQRDFFESLIETAQTIILVLDTQGRIVRFNPYMEKLVGYPLDEVKGMDWFETFLTPEIDRTIKPLFQKTVADVHTSGHVNPIIAKDGRTILVEWNNKTLKDKNGHTVGILAIGQDITERKRMEEALRRSEERFLLAMKASNDGLFDWNLETNDIYYSSAWKNILGYEDHELPNDFSIWENTTAPEDVKKSWDLQQKLITKQIDRFVMEFKMKHKDGHWVDILSRAEAIFNDNGKAIRMIGTHTDFTARKQAEEALAHSGKLMRFVIEHTNSGVAIHDRNLNYLYVSQRYLDMYDVQEQEVLGKHHYEVFPDLPQKWREAHQKALAGEVSSSDRDPYVRENGTVEYTRWECRPWYEADGSVGGIIVYTEVITGQLQQEQSLREYVEKLGESEENLRITLRSIGDAVISTDVDGRVVSMNPVAESLTGWSEKEAAGEPLDEVFRIINEQTRQTVESPVTNVLKTGQIVGLANHTLLIAKDGKETPIADSGAPICNVRGETTGVVLVFRDQTQERDSRLVLEESEARLRRAQKVAQVGDWEFNLKTGTFNASDSAREIYGLTDCDLCIEDVQKIPLSQYRPLLDAAMNDLIHEGTPYDVEFIIRRASDQTLVEIYSAAEYDPQTGTVFGVIQDITERKQVEAERVSLQEQLLQSQKMESVGRLAGGVAHDFNNMLGVIIGHAEIQLRRMEKENPVRGSMESIQNAAKRSADLTGQLLAFARKQTIAPKILDLNETVEGMLKMLRRLIGEDIGSVWNPGGNIHPVFMDPSQLDQILVNLCVNARDAIEDVGKITIETEYVILDDAYCAVHTDAIPGKYTLLAVSDDGCGMDEEIRLKIFDPFFTTKGLGKGTGLGLSTVYGIVRQNNGFINVYSEPGRGTTFRIYIPIHQGEPEAEAEVAALETTRGNGETILLVEDEPALLDMICDILEELGYRVIPVGGPLPALAEAAKEDCQPDLVITDVVMPVMNGKEMAEKILQNCPEMKVLFMSGYTPNSIVHHGVLDKGVSFIQKPFSVHDLGVKVREVLGN